MRRWLAGCCLLMVSTRVVPGQPIPNHGLRLDARSSMQWSGDTLMLLGAHATFQVLPVDTIHDVWMGPARGAFTVLSNRGIGLLLGNTLGPSAHPFGAGALLRSSRPEVVVACVGEQGGGPRTRFVEWRPGDRQRELLVAPGAVIDFDVDVPGRLVMLLADGRVLVADGRTLREVVRRGPGAPGAGERLRRVYVDDRGSEIALLGERALYRLLTGNGEWQVTEVDPRRDALVRHAASRRMRVETRFTTGGTSQGGDLPVGVDERTLGGARVVWAAPRIAP